jgi:peroxiredoxin
MKLIQSMIAALLWSMTTALFLGCALAAQGGGHEGVFPQGAVPRGALPQFSLSDTAGRVHTPAEWAGKRAIVLFFVSTDCPLSNRYVPELNRLDRAYASRAVVFYAVQGDATVAAEEVRRHAKEFGYRFPYLLDPQQLLSTYTGATTIPEVAVLSPSGRLLYLGRIDNRLEDYGKERVQVTAFDLRDALDATLRGKPVTHPRTRAVGCAIAKIK